MVEIPWIVEDLYNQTVWIPDEKDRSDYLGRNPLFIYNLYGFYYGLRAGFQLSNALWGRDFSPAAE